MAEVLGAQLQLDIATFAQSLQNAAQMVQQFAQGVSQQMQAIAAPFQQMIAAQQTLVQSTQQLTSAYTAQAQTRQQATVQMQAAMQQELQLTVQGATNAVQVQRASANEIVRIKRDAADEGLSITMGAADRAREITRQAADDARTARQDALFITRDAQDKVTAIKREAAQEARQLGRTAADESAQLQRASTEQIKQVKAQEKQALQAIAQQEKQINAEAALATAQQWAQAATQSAEAVKQFQRQTTAAMQQGGEAGKQAAQQYAAAAKQAHQETVLAALKAQAEIRTAVKNGTDEVATSAQRLGIQVKDVYAQSSAASKQATRDAEGLHGAYSRMLGMIGQSIAFSLVFQAISLIQQGIAAIFTSAAQLDRLTTAFTTITGSAQGAAQQLALVKDIANQTGRNFLELADVSVRLQGSTQAVGLSQQQSNQILLAASSVSQRYGLDTQKTSQLVETFSQTIAKGTVSGSELVALLGKAFPGALELVARGLGKHVTDLQNMTQQDQLGVVVIGKLVDEIKKMGPAAQGSSAQTLGEFQKLGNNIVDLAAKVGQAIISLLSPIAKIINSTIEFLGKSQAGVTGPYTDLIQRIATQRGLDASLVASMIQAESGGDRNAVSPKGAVGLMQLMPATAQEMGVNPVNLTMPAINISAGTQYLAKIFADLQTFSAKLGVTLQEMDKLAVASYNAGPGAVQSALRQAIASGKPLSYAGIASSLPSETQKYVTAVMTGMGRPDVISAGASGGVTAGGTMPTIDENAANLAQVEKIHRQIIEALKTQEQLKKLGNEDTNVAQQKAQAILELLKQEVQWSAQHGNIGKKLVEQDIARYNALTGQAEAFQRMQQALNTKPRALDDIQKDVEAIHAAMEVSDGLPGQMEAFQKKLDELNVEKLQALGVATDFQSRATQDMAKRVSDATAELKKENTAIDEQHTALDKLQRLTEADDPIEKQRIASLQQLNNALKALQGTSVATATQLQEIAERDRTAINQHAADQRLKQEEEAARKALKPWEELGKGIQSTLSGVFQNILSGSGSLLDTLKTMFIKFLAELAATALTNAIIIPAVIQVFGGGGSGIASFFGGSGGSSAESGGTSAGGGVSSLFGQASNLASLYRQFGGKTPSLFGNLANMPISDVPGVGGLFGAASAPAAPAAGAVEGAGSFAAADAAGSEGLVVGSATTVGQVAGAAGAGIAAGMIISKLNSMLGLHGIANTTLSGAAGGAIAGTIILPGIGTIIGGAIGALGGFIAGLLGSNKQEPKFDINQVGFKSGGTQPVSFDPNIGLHLNTGFTINQSNLKDIGRFPLAEFIEQLNGAVTGLFDQAISGFRSASPDVQKMLLFPLNEIANITARKIEETKFEGDDWAEKLKQYLGSELPKQIEDMIKPLRDAVNKVEPVIQQFASIIDVLRKDIKTLSEQQQGLHDSFQGALNSLMTELYSPAQAFLYAQEQLATLQQQFDVGTPKERLELAPKIAQGATQLLSLAKSPEVLGQDPQAVRDLQAQLMEQVKTVRGGVDTTFTDLQGALQEQIDVAKAQQDILANSLQDLNSVDGVVQQSLDVLNQMNATLGGPLNISQDDAVTQAQLLLFAKIAGTGSEQLGVLQSIDSKIGNLSGAPAGAGNASSDSGGSEGGSFASGVAYVPQNMLAQVHQGEMIIPAAQVAAGGKTLAALFGGAHTPEGGLSLAGGAHAAMQSLATLGLQNSLGAGTPSAGGMTLANLQGAQTPEQHIPRNLSSPSRAGNTPVQYAGEGDTISVTIRAEGDTPTGGQLVNQIADVVEQRVVNRIVVGGGRLKNVPVVVRRTV